MRSDEMCQDLAARRRLPNLLDCLSVCRFLETRNPHRNQPMTRMGGGNPFPFPSPFPFPMESVGMAPPESGTETGSGVVER
jgi:hypothetical protein